MAVPDPDPDLPPTLNPSTLTSAIASLAPALELLERFHHRNKNQHRLSKWWAQADMLRRHVRKMLGELEAGFEGAEKAVRVRERQKRKGKVVTEGDETGGMVGKRAGYLRWRLGPGAFLAFTQLSADRQFAHLGLMLLGVLAQVDKAVAPFAPPPPDEMGDGAGEQAAAAVEPVPGRDTAQGEDHDSMMEIDTDMGVAVSRDEIMASIERDAASTPIPPSASATETQPAVAGQAHPRSISLPVNTTSNKRKLLSQPPTAKTEPASKEPSTTPSLIPGKPKKKKLRKAEDEFDDIFSSLERPLSSKTKPRSAETQAKQPSSKEPSSTGTPAPGPGQGEVKPKKKKVREEEEGGRGEGGDEFDDIFASLDSETKKPKKKKRKKGDEFDDIFGGL